MGKNTDNSFVTLKRINDQETKPVAAYPLPGGSERILFPNPFDQDTEWYDEYMDLLAVFQRTAKYSVLLKFWLTEKDYEALLNAHPRSRDILSVVQSVVAHYESDAVGLGS